MSYVNAGVFWHVVWKLHMQVLTIMSEVADIDASASIANSY